MRLPLAALALTSIAFSTLSCETKKPAWKNHTFTTQETSRSSAEAMLPRSLWDQITGLLNGSKAAASEGKIEHGEASGHSSEGPMSYRNGPLPSVFAPLKVYLIEKNHGILQRGNTEISFAAGGGVLDLHDYVQPKSGSFYLAAEFLPEKEGVERKVYYLSHAVARKIDGETYGAGCNTYFDISNGFAKAMKSDGFLLNTTSGRHVSALSGTYFFAAVDGGKLYLASLTIKDSSLAKLQCGEN